MIEPFCNGDVVEGMTTLEATNYLINLGLFTMDEIVDSDVIEEKTEKYCKPNLPENASRYISRIYNDSTSGLTESIIEYTKDNKEKKVNAGIRYVGSNPNNKVYYNCDDKDSNNVSYGEENYDYANSCEIWRIIGAFNVKDENGNMEKRVKIINTASTFEASWDSSASDVNFGYGINQWGESTYEDGSIYKGADLMQLLNGYYIGKVGAECKLCDGENQEICSQTCTVESLKSENMKVLTNTAKGMIDEVVWDTYAVSNVSTIEERYLQERGISNQYTGKICTPDNGCCSDKVNRTQVGQDL